MPGGAPPAGNRKHLPWIVAAAILAALLYGRLFNNELAGWDGAGPGPSAAAAWKLGLADIWLKIESPGHAPLASTLLWLEGRLWPDISLGFHAVNLLLHVLNVVLFMLLLQRFGLSPMLVFAAATLFAVSPIQVMAVAWTGAVKTLLSTCLGLLALIGCSAYFERKRGWVLGLALIAFATGLLADASLAVLPVLVLATGVWIYETSPGRATRIVVPMVLLAMAWTFLLVTAEQGADINSDTASIFRRMLAVPAAGLSYAAKTLVPVSLSPLYPPWDLAPGRVTTWLWPSGVAMLLIALFLVRRRLHPLQKWSLAFFALFLGPALVRILFSKAPATWLSDRLVYTASMGLYLIVVVTVAQTWRRWPAPAGGAIGAVLFGIAAVWLGIMTWKQIPTWKDTLTVWQTTVDKYPQMYEAHAGLARTRASLGQPEKALADFRKALSMRPDDAELRVDLGETLMNLGQFDQAESELRRALQTQPDLIRAMYTLGQSAERRGQFEAAEEHYRSVLSKRPANEGAAASLAGLLIRLGKAEEAEKVLTEGLDQNPQSTHLTRLVGILREQQGRLEEAEEQFRKVVSIDPLDAEGHFGWGALAARMGRRDEAIGHYLRAIELDGAKAPYWNNLGSVLLDQGKTKEAAEKFQKAVDLDPQDALAWNNLGSARDLLGEPERSIEYFRRAVELRPNYAAAHQRLGQALAKADRYRDAVSQLNKAIGLVSPEASVGLALSMTRMLASCPDESVRNPDLALRLAPQVCEQTGYQVPEALDVLGMAYAAGKLYDQAVMAAEQAIKLLQDQGRSDEVPPVEERLKLYREGKSYVAP